MSDMSTSAAPKGKRCDRCLCCDGIIVFNEETLCAACDDGTHPALPERDRRAVLAVFDSEAKAHPIPALPEQRVSSQQPGTPKRRPLDPEFEKALVSMGVSLGASEIRVCPPPTNPENRADELIVRFNERDNSMTARIKSVYPSGTRAVANASPTPLTAEEDMKLAKPEIEEAIRKAGPDEPAGDLATRLKIDVGTVYYFRAKIRKQARKTGANPTAPARINHADRAAHGNATERAAKAVASWPVTLNVSVETMDKWFASLEADVKAAIFTQNFQFPVPAR